MVGCMRFSWCEAARRGGTTAGRGLCGGGELAVGALPGTGFGSGGGELAIERPAVFVEPVGGDDAAVSPLADGCGGDAAEPGDLDGGEQLLHRGLLGYDEGPDRGGRALLEVGARVVLSAA